MRLLRCLLLALLGFALLACQRIDEKRFVGTWQSSRTNTPLHLNANGEWEIRTPEGTVLQYGVWRYEDKSLIWTFRQEDRLIDDRNPVLSVESDGFSLRERDGSTTVFRRMR